MLGRWAAVVTLGSSTAHTVTISDDASTGAVSGFVWIDGNNNQTRDANEFPIPGVTVRLTGTNSSGQAVEKFRQNVQNLV